MSGVSEQPLSTASLLQALRAAANHCVSGDRPQQSVTFQSGGRSDSLRPLVLGLCNGHKGGVVTKPDLFFAAFSRLENAPTTPEGGCFKRHPIQLEALGCAGLAIAPAFRQ